VERHAASVVSAGPLAADFSAEISARLGRIYGAGVNISFSENPALLGGLRIQVGSDLYDGSVRAKLERLKQSF